MPSRQANSLTSLVNETVHDHTGAFNALLEATNQQEIEDASRHTPSSTIDRVGRLSSSGAINSEHTGIEESTYEEIDHRNVPAAWQNNWLVKQGWLHAEEAAWYIKMCEDCSYFRTMVKINGLFRFFQHLSKMTPILLEFFARPQNHAFLNLQEPILCYTILTIASEHFQLPTRSTPFCGHDIHLKAWNVTKQLLNRVLWAQERGPKSKLRTMGTVLAILLLIEWPPRATALPPDDMADIVRYHETVDDSERERRDFPTFPTLEDEDRQIRIRTGKPPTRRKS